MSRWRMPTCAMSLCALFLIVPGVAQAQLGGRMGGGGAMGKGGEEKPEKPKVAEQGAKPREPKKARATGTWGDKKPMQMLELGGYFRMRSDVFHNLHLGLQDVNGSTPPFARPLQYYATGTGGLCSGSDPPDSCSKGTILSTNMRLRLAPTLNVHSRARVRMIVDIFDNLVLGSTPEGSSMTGGARPANAPLNGFSTTQEVPQAGRNSVYDALLVKAAWGEVDLPFGRLLFGRIPTHWGLGLVANSGTCAGYSRWTVRHKGDPERCTDSDYGDLTDRIMFVTRIPVIDLTVGFAWDFQAAGMTTWNLSGSQVALNPGQPTDLTPADNLQQWTVFLGRIDTPTRVRQRLAAGDVVFNYGTRWVFQKQELDTAWGSELIGDTGQLAGTLVNRKAFVMMPDLWLRLHWGKLQLEFEGVIKYGWIRQTSDVTGVLTEDDKDLEILQFGWVLRGAYRFLKDKLVIGVEVGMASGDDRIEGAEGSLHYSGLPQLAPGGSNRTSSLFLFDPNYRVDLIFFRELMGTVYNAAYLKPTVQYHILDDLTARLDMIYSFAVESVATPANKRHYGVELDLDLEYRWPETGFFAGIAYGVFFPLDALHRPEEIYGTGTGLPAKASIAHSVQLRATIKF